MLGVDSEFGYIFPNDNGVVAGTYAEPPTGPATPGINLNGTLFTEPIRFSISKGVMNSIGTNTIEGGLTISAGNANTPLPVNHIHSIGPRGAIFLVGTDESPPAGAGCSMTVLPGSTDVAGTIKLTINGVAGGVNCFSASIYNPATPGAPVTLLEYKFNTPYMQRASGRFGAPVVILTTDATLAPFGFTLGPVIETVNTGGGVGGTTSATSSTVLAWNQKFLPNTTMTSLCDGFVIVPTLKTAGAAFTDPFEIEGYIRYHVICPLEA